MAPIAGRCKEVEAFRQEMTQAGADLTFLANHQTLHSFTEPEPETGSGSSKACASYARSATRGRIAMKDVPAEAVCP